MVKKFTSKIRWNSEKEKYLIDLIKPRRCLWDSKDKSFLKRKKKMKIYSQICTQLKSKWPEQLKDLTNAEVLKKFAMFRTYYRQQKKSEKKANLQSGVNCFEPRWEHFKRCSFLSESSIVGESVSPESSSDSSSSDSVNSNETEIIIKEEIEVDESEKTEILPFTFQPMISETEHIESALATYQPVVCESEQLEPGAFTYQPKIEKVQTMAALSTSKPGISRQEQLNSELSSSQFSIVHRKRGPAESGMVQKTQTRDELFAQYLVSLLETEEDETKKFQLHMDIIQLVRKSLNI